MSENDLSVEIDNAIKLSHSQAVACLRDLAVKLLNQGFNKKELLEVFTDFHKNLSSTEVSKKEIIEDILDMLTGSYVGKNL